MQAETLLDCSSSVSSSQGDDDDGYLATSHFCFDNDMYADDDEAEDVDANVAAIVN